MTTVATKTVTIIARIQFKNDPRKVCYLVRSSNGVDQYTTCLFNGKAVSCNGCPSHGNCYHRTGCEKVEAARKAASTPCSAKVTPHRQQEDWSTPDGPLYKEVSGNSQSASTPCKGADEPSYESKAVKLINKVTMFEMMFAKYDYRQQEPVWVVMPNGTKRLASQIDDPCLNSLNKMTEAYNKMQAEWDVTYEERVRGKGWQSQIDAIMNGQTVKVERGAFCLAR